MLVAQKDEEIAQGGKLSAEANTALSRELQALQQELQSVHTERQQLRERLQVCLELLVISSQFYMSTI